MRATAMNIISFPMNVLAVLFFVVYVIVVLAPMYLVFKLGQALGLDGEGKIHFEYHRIKWYR